MSRDFCISNAAALGITPLTEASLPGCQTPVVEYMRAAAIRSLEDKKAAAAAPAAAATAAGAIQVTDMTRPAMSCPLVPCPLSSCPHHHSPSVPFSLLLSPSQTVLTIQNQQVQFQVQPTEASVLAVSRDFCIDNQAALGIAPLTEASLPQCQQPLLDALVQAVRSELTSKTAAAAAAAKQAQAEAEAQEQVAEVKVSELHTCPVCPTHSLTH